MELARLLILSATILCPTIRQIQSELIEQILEAFSDLDGKTSISKKTRVFTTMVCQRSFANA